MRARHPGPDAEHEVADMIAEITGLSRTEQAARGREAVDAGDRDRIMALMERRISGEPLDHILGRREFMGRRFAVTREVLSPREDTEVLVRRALDMAKGVEGMRLLDLGTGTGAVAISLLLALPDASALAVDLSPEALLVAEDNARAHGVADRLDLVQGSWFAAVEGRYDLIVSNPPYITDAAMRDLEREVADYDPALALAGGPDGLDAFRVIAGQARAHLQAGAPIALEIGYDLGPTVMALLAEAGFEDLAITRDLAGHDRVVTGRNPAHNHT